MKYPRAILLPLLMSLVFVHSVLGHAPLTPGRNESLAEATPIPDPAKSWAVYDKLHEGREAHYYRFSITQGERIYVSLFISPASMDRRFAPALALMGSGISTETAVPDYVETPKASGVLVVQAKPPAQATYEAFSPSTFFQLASLDISAPASGTYYLAVYEPYQGGYYGLAVGYVESFTLTEWMLTPVNLLSIYQWQEQSLTFIFGPMAVVIAIGLSLLAWQRRKKNIPVGLLGWTGGLAGLLSLGTTATVLSQMILALTRVPAVPEMAVTLILASIPMLLGIVTLRLTLRIQREITFRRRIYFVCIGFLALFGWAGYLAGPVMAFITSILPSRTKPR